jgi:hypothetical protein
MGSESPNRGRNVVIVMVILIIVGSFSLTYFMHVSSRQVVRALDSDNPAKVSDSLLLLRDRRDPAGIAKAKELLKSDNTDVWTSAALYLGVMGKKESIPYLVKALNGASDEDAHEMAMDLAEMTGRDYGNNYDAWEAWLKTGKP